MSSRKSLESRDIDGVPENRVPQSRLQTIAHDEIHVAVESAFEETEEPHVVAEGLPVEIDQEVKVAGLFGTAAAGRTKDLEARYERKLPDP